MRKVIGYTLLLVSCIAWGLLPLVPFLPYKAGELAAIGGALFIFAEITWWLAMPLLGKEIIGLSKRYWQYIKRIFKPGVEAKDE